jgi:hypothetical protein
MARYSPGKTTQGTATDFIITLPNACRGQKKLQAMPLSFDSIGWIIINPARFCNLLLMQPILCQ